MRTPLHLIQYIHSTLVQLLEVITTNGAFSIILRIINSANFERKNSSFVQMHLLLYAQSCGELAMSIPNMLGSGHEAITAKVNSWSNYNCFQIRILMEQIIEKFRFVFCINFMTIFFLLGMKKNHSTVVNMLWKLSSSRGKTWPALISPCSPLLCHFDIVQNQNNRHN